MYRFAALGRFLATCSSGPRALKVGLPLYFAVGICATIIFSHQGLEASTVVRSAERDPTTRLVLLLAWVVATLPVARAILCAEENLFLRTLPVPRWSILLWLGMLLSCAELPWCLLWTRGGGATRGLGATLTVLALHACLVSGMRKPMDVVSAVLAGAAWLALPPVPRAIAGVVIGLLALSRAWQRAPELRAARRAGVIRGTPALALAIAYGLVMARRHGAALARAAFFVGIAMVWTALAARNDEGVTGATLLRAATAVWIPSSIFATATVLGPIFRTEAAAEWVLVSSGTTMRQRRAATTGLVVAASGGAALFAGLAVGAALGVPLPFRLVLAGTLVLSGAVLCACVDVGMRWAIRGRGNDGGRLVLTLGALIVLAEGALWLYPV